MRSVLAFWFFMCLLVFKSIWSQARLQVWVSKNVCMPILPKFVEPKRLSRLWIAGSVKTY